jgi:hypothetical protein
LRLDIADTEAHPSGDGRLKLIVVLDGAALTSRIECVYLDWLFAREHQTSCLFEFFQRDISAVLRCRYTLVIRPDHPCSNILDPAIKVNWDCDVVEYDGARRRKSELPYGW